jgi:predicted NUDIX family NTP pyrophosphohydrolase
LKKSAGLLLFRRGSNGLEVFLGHPGGPLWAKKDENAWSIPKGEVEEDEDLLSAAIREFEEETGFSVTGDFIALKPVVQPSGKVVHAWALQRDLDAAAIKSNLFSMEWPPKSGKMRQFPEIDRAAWFPVGAARKHIFKGQEPLLTQLAEKIAQEKERQSR